MVQPQPQKRALLEASSSFSSTTVRFRLDFPQSRPHALDWQNFLGTLYKEIFVNWIFLFPGHLSAWTTSRLWLFSAPKFLSKDGSVSSLMYVHFDCSWCLSNWKAIPSLRLSFCKLGFLSPCIPPVLQNSLRIQAAQALFPQGGFGSFILCFYISELSHWETKQIAHHWRGFVFSSLLSYNALRYEKHYTAQGSKKLGVNSYSYKGISISKDLVG